MNQPTAQELTDDKIRHDTEKEQYKEELYQIAAEYLSPEEAAKMSVSDIEKWLEESEVAANAH